MVEISDVQCTIPAPELRTFHASDSSSLPAVQQGLAEIMSRFDVPGLGPPAKVPKALPFEVEVRGLVREATAKCLKLTDSHGKSRTERWF